MKGKRVSLADIAAKLGISKSAVSLALNDSPMVSPKTRALVAKAARSMGYSRNSLVSSMMSSIKRDGGGSFSETIALVNGNRDEFALTNHPTLPKYCVGIREEAERLGYRINEFWLHDPKMTGERFFRALRSRGIRGGIILGHSFGSVFPPSFKRVWENFYFVSAGIKTRDPNLEMVSADHYAITYRAASNAIARGRRRPALVMDEHIDNLVDGRFAAGFLRAQMSLPESGRVPPFMLSETAPDYAEKLGKWFSKYSPDAVLYLMESARAALEKIAKRPRGKTLFIQLERRDNAPNWVGMEQNNDIVGRVALRRLADMLNRNSSVAGENANILTLIPPVWVE